MGKMPPSIPAPARDNRRRFDDPPRHQPSGRTRIMSRHLTRRRFMQGSAALAAAAMTGSLAAEEKKAPPSERLNLGVIGVAAQGAYNLGQVTSENIVALCDVDADHAGKAREAHPKAKFYQDYR